MGLWPFGRSKADIESASRVIVLRARDGLAMRAKVTVRLSEPQTQAAADELAERAADLLRAVVREAPRAPAVLGLEVALAAEVTTRMLKEPIPLRGIEIAGLHIVGDPGHLTQPAASSMSSPAWMQAAHASPPSSSTPDWPDRSLDRPTPVQPLPAARPDLSSAAASSAAKPASSAKPASAPKPTVARPGAPRPAPAGAPASGPTSPDRAQPAFSAAPASPARAAADAPSSSTRAQPSPRGTPASAPPPPRTQASPAVAPAVAPTAAATPTAAAAPAVAPTAAATPAAAPAAAPTAAAAPAVTPATAAAPTAAATVDPSQAITVPAPAAAVAAALAEAARRSTAPAPARIDPFARTAVSVSPVPAAPLHEVSSLATAHIAVTAAAGALAAELTAPGARAAAQSSSGPPPRPHDPFASTAVSPLHPPAASPFARPDAAPPSAAPSSAAPSSRAPATSSNPPHDRPLSGPPSSRAAYGMVRPGAVPAPARVPFTPDESSSPSHRYGHLDPPASPGPRSAPPTARPTARRILLAIPALQPRQPWRAPSTSRRYSHLTPDEPSTSSRRYSHAGPPSSAALRSGHPSGAPPSRTSARPPPAAVAARRRVVASRLHLPNGAGPYEVARGLTPLLRDTAGRILVAFLRTYDLTVIRRVPFDAVEGDILSSLTAPSDGAPGTYTASHSAEIQRWREAFGSAKLDKLQREASLAAAAVAFEALSAEGVPSRAANAVLEGLAGSAFGDPDMILDVGRYLFPAHDTLAIEALASMIALAGEDMPPDLEPALEPLFASLREEVTAAALIVRDVIVDV
ncbi:MAG: hypothetical protein R3B70_26880 [Polyangiaceae bacterium]